MTRACPFRAVRPMPRDAHVKPLFVCSRTTHAALWMSPELTPSPRCRTAGWRTLTFPAVPRVSRLLAPGVIDGPINSVAWLAYVQQSAYQRCTWVTSSSSTISAVTKARQPGRGLSRSARVGLRPAVHPATGRVAVFRGGAHALLRGVAGSSKDGLLLKACCASP